MRYFFYNDCTKRERAWVSAIYGIKKREYLRASKRSENKDEQEIKKGGVYTPPLNKQQKDF